MNKRAAVAGVTKAHDQLLFRTQHPASLRSGEAVRKAPPQLPSDVDPAFTYGVPGTYRSAEQVRAASSTCTSRFQSIVNHVPRL